MNSRFSTINIFSKLKSKYEEYLRPEITSVVMIQSEEDVWLEIVETKLLSDGLEKETVTRSNLDFIADAGDDYFFDPKDSIETNARKFIDDFTPYSIINTTDLFREEASQKISKKYNVFDKDD